MVPLANYYFLSSLKRGSPQIDRCTPFALVLHRVGESPVTLRRRLGREPINSDRSADVRFVARNGLKSDIAPCADFVAKVGYGGWMPVSQWVVAERPAMRTDGDSERCQRGQIRPGHLEARAIVAGQASGCASSGRTASRSFCVHVVIARRLRCPRKTGQRLGRAHGCRAGSCETGPSGSTAL